jgi:hypothetical protein
MGMKSRRLVVTRSQTIFQHYGVREEGDDMGSPLGTRQGEIIAGGALKPGTKRIIEVLYVDDEDFDG